jgi:hypothetical protein
MRQLMLLLLFATPVFAGGLRELAPSWKPGLEWSTETDATMFVMTAAGEGVERDPSNKVRVSYKVRGTVDIGGVSCHELVVSSAHRPELKVVVLVRKQDLSVKEVRFGERHVTNERTPFLLLEESALGPLDFPLFPVETRN